MQKYGPLESVLDLTKHMFMTLWTDHSHTERDFFPIYNYYCVVIFGPLGSCSVCCLHLKKEFRSCANIYIAKSGKSLSFKATRFWMHLLKKYCTNSWPAGFVRDHSGTVRCPADFTRLTQMSTCK